MNHINKKYFILLPIRLFLSKKRMMKKLSLDTFSETELIGINDDTAILGRGNRGD
jgi:hypothetical protein